MEAPWFLDVGVGRGIICPFRRPGGYRSTVSGSNLQLGLDLTALCSGAGCLGILVSRVVIRVRMHGMGVAAPYVCTS